MTKYLMFQGTSSNVGKSVLTTALCKILASEGLQVAPFKAQNMSLNSFVTLEGLEMGRAQVAQAEAANILPSIEMNPILLKPVGNSRSQVIVNGKPIGVMSANEYHKNYSSEAFEIVKKALINLSKKFEVIVIEGAGSPVEINLKANDIVNMKVAKFLNAPVILVTDIDRGGSLAAIVGTLELLDDVEKKLIKGVVINKFRGDLDLFLPAIDFIENKIKKPVLGVIPFIDQIGVDNEDSVALEEKSHSKNSDVNIAVIRFKKISNFTDFDSLASESDVNLFYTACPEELETVDMIILPGSKNTSEDLIDLKNNHILEKILQRFHAGTVIVGICGGFQMLGKKILDPFKTESDYIELDGLKLLPIETIFSREKFTRQIIIPEISISFLGEQISSKNLKGYEIHAGMSDVNVQNIIAKENVFGTYIHGIFDNDDFRRKFLNVIRIKKNLPPLKISRNFKNEKQKNYDRLAKIVSENLNMHLLKKILNRLE